jgi:hypothetical protein
MDLSDVYELVEGEELVQGDILENCPVFYPSAKILDEENNIEDVFIETEKIDVLVMSQSCDLVATQKQDFWQVILCPLWSLSKAAEANQFLASNLGKEMCRRGHLSGYHMLHPCKSEDWQKEVSIVSFREIYSLPFNVILEFIKKKERRPRIKSPYREHLSQAFARYFMRVGLPVDIPPFKKNNTEEKILEKIFALDDEARKRILETIQSM